MVNFDSWRESYDRTTFAQQAAFYDELACDYPKQNDYDWASVSVALPGIRHVTEIGGWRGELADQALAAFPLIRWVNYEISSWAVGRGSRCDDWRYSGIALSDWPWRQWLWPAHLFVANHVIEHMRFAQFEELSKQFVKYRRLHLQIPIPLDGGADWDGYEGTHALEVGWDEVDALLRSRGFDCTHADETQTRRTYECFTATKMDGTSSFV